MADLLGANTERRKITYDQEIPLAIQIVTSKSEINSYNVDSFSKPFAYGEDGYEHVKFRMGNVENFDVKLRVLYLREEFYTIFRKNVLIMWIMLISYPHLLRTIES